MINGSLPASVQVVIVGGGIVGCSVLYHLAKSGMSDVLLLERKTLTSGTTWHAAGLLAQLRSSKTETDLARYSINLYEQLETQTSQATGVRRNGTLCLAQTVQRWEELKRRHDQANVYGLETVLLSDVEIGPIWPLIDTKDLTGGLLIPSDGQGDPTGITLALSEAAKGYGAIIKENCLVTDLSQNDKQGWCVKTTDGSIQSDIVVNCTGIWARDLAHKSSVSVPLHGVEHMYMVTEPMTGLDRKLPSVRDYDSSIYFKEDAGKLVLGGNEPNAKLWPVDQIPSDFEYSLLPEDWDHFECFMNQALDRIPALKETGIRQLIVGPESFTPDGKYLLGEAPNLKGYFVAAGFNSIGIASAGGVGLALSEWILEGEPTMDLSEIDIRRFQRFSGNRAFLRQRVPEIVATGFAVQYPFRELKSARGVRKSPIHQSLIERGAHFDQAIGWERPSFFGKADIELSHHRSFKRPPWFDQVGREHQAVREAVGVMDLTSFSKIQVCGKDALALLQKVSTRDVDVSIGQILYTLILTTSGCILCDLTVTRTGCETFLLVTGAKSHFNLLQHLERQESVHENVTIVDLTSAFSVIGVMGPNSRRLLQTLSDVDLSAQAFPLFSSKEIDLGLGFCRASRISYVGELGWELYIPTEFSLGIYEEIITVGKESNLVDVGFHALDSLRLECGYRHYGSDISNTDTPMEAGLEFLVDCDSDKRNTGKVSDLGSPGQVSGRRLMAFKINDPDHFLHGKEPVYRGDKLIGSITSAAFGYTVGSSIGLGYIVLEDWDNNLALSGADFQIGIAGEKVPASASFEPLYKPRRNI